MTETITKDVSVFDRDVRAFDLVGEIQHTGRIYELRRVFALEIGADIGVLLHRPTMRHIDWIIGRVRAAPAEEIDLAAKTLTGILEEAGGE